MRSVLVSIVAAGFVGLFAVGCAADATDDGSDGSDGSDEQATEETQSAQTARGYGLPPAMCTKGGKKFLDKSMTCSTIDSRGSSKVLVCKAGKWVTIYDCNKAHLFCESVPGEKGFMVAYCQSF